MKSILVTGGAGYIGSFMTKKLLDEGYSVVVIDSLERGNKDSVDDRAEFIEGNLLDKEFVSSIFSKSQVDAVIHFAGFISMAESMREPELYFANNVEASNNLIVNLINRKIPIVFSSTAGVYGNPKSIPIDEDHPKNPTNPYGESKLITENILSWYSKIHNLPVACLRYFNASGASLDGSMGENHHPESHIIPNIINAAINDKEFVLYGDDYDTEDGTAVRDYIHVLDLVQAHLLSLNKLFTTPDHYKYNVGTGKGYSNREVFEAVKRVSNKDILLKIADRRPGDASILVANTDKIKNELGFTASHSDINTIVESAWKWHSRLT